MTVTAELAFSHVGFFVQDIRRMEDFYRRLMGFTVTDRGDLDTPAGQVALVFLSRDPAEHHQVVLASGRPTELPFNIINQISFRAKNLADLKRLHAAITAEPGLEEIRTVTHGNAISIYFRDPEGNRIELFVDTPWHCIQPMRESVDFSKPDEDILADAYRIASAAANFMPRERWIEKMRQNMAAGINA
jgi:catechol 2,3-dioxygenase-like lactoylglutathione lyase family enzyme